VVLVTVAAVLIGPALAGHLWARRHDRLGREDLARGEFAAAREHFEHCLKIWFWSTDARLLAARAARMAGAYDVARGFLRDCQWYGGPEDAIGVEYRLMRAQQGDFAEVEEGLVHDVLQGHPQSITILEVLVPIYLRDYRLAEASECITRWLEREPDRMEAWLYRARICEYFHQHEEAAESYRRVLELDPANDEARLVLAGGLIASNHPEEALRHFEILKPRLGDSPRVLAGMAACLRALNQPEEARRLLDRAIEIEPNNGALLEHRALLATQLESPAAAEAWHRRAAAAQPNDRDTLYGFYQALLHVGKRREAEQVLARLKEIDADLDELKRLTQEIVNSPNNPELRCAAARVFLRTGQDTEALRWLNSALQKDPAHAGTHRMLADYYERKGDAEQASTHRRLAVYHP
jgi:tetratricopeptide (TPR) repeat protein